LVHLSSLSSSPTSLHKKAKTELVANHDDLSEETQSSNHEVRHTEKKHRNRTILEVGAGRGITGLLIAGVSAADDRRSINHTTTTTKLVLVERDGARGGRADTTARRGTGAARSSTNNNRPIHDKTNDDEIATTTTVSTAGSSSYAFDVSNLPCQRIKCDLAHVQLQIALQVDRTTTSTARQADDDTDHIGSHPNNQTATSSSNNEINNNNNNNNNEEELIVVAKHLCGCGTDYALKSLRPLRDHISTLVMATCCHGACNWRDYVGRDYVRHVMVKKAASSSPIDIDDDNKTRLSEFGDDEFKLLQLWSAGTVKVLDPRNKKVEDKSGSSSISLSSSSLSEPLERDDDEHGAAPVPAGLEETTKVFGVTRIVESLGLSCGEQGLGRACQRIIDYGRREFISHELLQLGPATDGAAAAELIYYVPDSTTPQNAMLIATRGRAENNSTLETR
jgi:tRNA:m4X modification enzyme